MLCNAIFLCHERYTSAAQHVLKGYKAANLKFNMQKTMPTIGIRKGLLDPETEIYSFLTCLDSSSQHKGQHIVWRRNLANFASASCISYIIS
jgi:hypothetical protein